MAGIAAIKAFLAKHDTTALPTVSPLIVFPSTIDLPTAFQTLLEKHISSAPVFDSANREFVGFLDTRDLLAWCVFASDEKNVKPSLKEVISVGVKAHASAVSGVTASYLARRHPFVTVDQTDKLDKVAALLARPDVHRVPVVSTDDKLVTVITQSTIAKFLHDHRADPALAPAMAMTVKDLGCGSAPVLTVAHSATAAETFKVMNGKGRSGLGIVDEEGKIIANTSASDVRLFLDNPASLTLNIAQFLGTVHRKDSNIHAPVVTVHDDTTLEHVVGKMVVSKVHRVFYTTMERKPISVISITDIMKLVTNA